MELEVWDNVFDQSPRLTYRARSGDTLSSSTLEVFEEEEEEVSPSPNSETDPPNDFPTQLRARAQSSSASLKRNGIVEENGEPHSDSS